VIKLAKDFGKTKPTKWEIRSTAYHEVCELLLGKLWTLAHNRFVSVNEVDSERHAIVQKMMNCQFKESFKKRF
jgi:hypothetical protein